MISNCHYPRALPPLPTQDRILYEKALELCHCKLELVLLTAIIESKDEKTEYLLIKERKREETQHL